MNGNRYLIDTNIAIYLFAGDERVADLLEGNQIIVSFITELELLSLKHFNPFEKAILKEFLTDVVILDINKTIKDLTIKLRAKSKLKLPDAIIAATAQFMKIPLITADKQFKRLDDPQILLYYP